MPTLRTSFVNSLVFAFHIHFDMFVHPNHTLASLQVRRYHHSDMWLFHVCQYRSLDKGHTEEFRMDLLRWNILQYK
ncbi:hypothetical protein X975_01611, partial [Stegodyphus mimosarum]